MAIRDDVDQIPAALPMWSMFKVVVSDEGAQPNLEAMIAEAHAVAWDGDVLFVVVGSEAEVKDLPANTDEGRTHREIYVLAKPGDDVGQAVYVMFQDEEEPEDEGGETSETGGEDGEA